MGTEIKTNDPDWPVTVIWTGDGIETYMCGEFIPYSKSEAIQLRKFLNQLNLGEDESN